MALDLTSDFIVDGIPPGSASKFGSGEMLDGLNGNLEANVENLGVEAAQNALMKEFLEKTGLGNDPKALALTIDTKGIGEVIDDGKEQSHDLAAQAGLEAAQVKADLDLGGSR